MDCRLFAPKSARISEQRVPIVDQVLRVAKNRPNRPGRARFRQSARASRTAGAPSPVSSPRFSAQRQRVHRALHPRRPECDRSPGSGPMAAAWGRGGWKVSGCYSRWPGGGVPGGWWLCAWVFSNRERPVTMAFAVAPKATICVSSVRTVGCRRRLSIYPLQVFPLPEVFPLRDPHKQQGEVDCRLRTLRTEPSGSDLNGTRDIGLGDHIRTVRQGSHRFAR